MVIRKASSSAASSAPFEENLLVFDEAPEFMTERDSAAGSLDNMDLKVKAAQEQLQQLRLQQEEIERQKQHLEGLRIKQERFVAGKRELLDKLGRSSTHIERELYEAQKRVEELGATHDEFRRHLDALKALQPEKWHRTQVDQELDLALVAIDDAEADYAKGMRRLQALAPVETAPHQLTPAHSAGADDLPAAARMLPSFVSGSDDLATWLRRGFAFTLPLMGTVLVAILLIRLMF